MGRSLRKIQEVLGLIVEFLLVCLRTRILQQKGKEIAQDDW